MKNKHKYYRLILAAVLLILIGCGNGGDEQVSETETNQANENTTQEVAVTDRDNPIEVLDRDEAILIDPSTTEEDVTEDVTTDDTVDTDEESEESTQEGEETESQESQETDADSEDEDSEETTQVASTDGELYDEDIYDLELLEVYDLDDIDIDQFDSEGEVIEYVLDQYGADRDALSISFYNFNTDESYYINEDNYIVAASTAKIPVGMAYTDLINEGTYSYATQLLYNDYYYVEGAGNIANSPAQVSYSIEDLMAEMIKYSDNTAWYTLVFNYPNNFGGIAQYILDTAGYYDVPQYFWMDNYGSAYLYEQVLKEVATNPDYEYLVELMLQTDPPQLFTSYVNTDVFANKYGRVDQQVNDAGIYYENDEPQYILVAFTDNLVSADNILEDLNLYLNLWYRQNYILS